jgi:hypothetical protein
MSLIIICAATSRSMFLKTSDIVASSSFAKIDGFDLAEFRLSNIPSLCSLDISKNSFATPETRLSTDTRGIFCI